MIQLYIKRLKCLTRNKESLFWSLVFPLILATCFYFAFSNLDSAAKFRTITVAIVSDLSEEELQKQPLITVMEQAVSESGTSPFELTFTDLNMAQELLTEKECTGYIVLSDMHLYVRENGISETILKSFLDEYMQKNNMIETVLEKNPNAMQEGLLDQVVSDIKFTEDKNSDKKPDMLLIYFYSLLAFTCMFAANAGVDEIVTIQADQSEVAARLNVTPTHKMKLFLCNLSAALTIHITSLVILFFYMRDILHVSFGNRMGLILLTCIIGSLVGMFLGSAICIWVKKKRELKDAIVMSIQMICAGLSGLFGTSSIKYLIANKIPLLGYINPTNVLTDCFYSLYYYENLDTYFLNFTLLVGMAVVLCVITYLGLRRKTYASI